MFTHESVQDASLSANVTVAPNRRRSLPFEALQQLIIQTLDDRKGEDIVTVSLTGKADFADAMVICSGTSQRHVASLADYVVRALKDHGAEPLSVEGLEAAEWVLVDAGDVIVHIFRNEARKLYNLEKMWAVALPAAE